jgi:hypothetical protein
MYFVPRALWNGTIPPFTGDRAIGNAPHCYMHVMVGSLDTGIHLQRLQSMSTHTSKVIEILITDTA